MKKSKLKIAILIIFLIIVVVILGGFIYYKSSLKAIKNNKTVIVDIPKQSGVADIAKILKDNDLIKNDFTFKVYCKLNKKVNMQAGKYEISDDMDVKQIIEKLEKGDIYSEEITITFLEGKNMRNIAKIIAENTVNSEDDVFKLLKDEEYLDKIIDKYSFLTDEIKNDDIYYSLEGYLFPDTYTFENKNVSVENIFGKMLDKMDSVLKEYEMEIKSMKNYSIHNILTLASMLEQEGISLNDRSKIATVFYNRLKAKMPLQSDVTTYYGLKIDMGERDLTEAEINDKNPYNTRNYESAGKLPVGPVCSPSRESIEAIINPSQDDDVKKALYFVADKNGKVYFNNTNSEHEKTIRELKQEGLWYEYE